VSTLPAPGSSGANPVLHEATPLTAIRNDRGEDLMLAVKVLLEDTPDA